MFENFQSVVDADSEDRGLLEQIEPARLPKHIAIIMDGNGRWAKQRGKPRLFGHQEGAESVRAVLDTSVRLGIQAVTLFAFSTENWRRPQDEVTGLMQMLKLYLKREMKVVHGNNMRFRTIGDLESMPEEIQSAIEAARRQTEGNTGTILNLALNYGGKAEILQAVKKAISKLGADGRVVSELSEDDVEKELYTSGLPDVDLLIRTSGEFRISNFLLWQIAYSEIYVTPVLFPDFRRTEFLKAIIEFQKRERRFGGVDGE